ncbi:MAG: hypothetical protein DSY50_07555 [Desulfobulbus sp.]|nr:MAG: hypothetical protein DSY50_07555 [Desulfobulbus sp.]RUM38169.1 MAG: hypothetical protein DSY70_08395 [Desulfobulbus sp.]
MKSKTLYHFFLISFLSCLVLLSPVQAAEDKDPTIEEIVLTTSSSELLLFATVENSFTDTMLEGVRNGIPITFRFTIILDKIRSAWFDLSLFEETINHTLRYDAVKQTYQIDFSEKNRSQLTRSVETAKQLMSDLNGIQIIALKKLHPDARYALQIKATLVENTLPLGIHYLLPFTSLWNFETDWRTVEFRY